MNVTLNNNVHVYLEKQKCSMLASPIFRWIVLLQTFWHLSTISSEVVRRFGWLDPARDCMVGLAASCWNGSLLLWWWCLVSWCGTVWLAMLLVSIPLFFPLPADPVGCHLHLPVNAPTIFRSASTLPSSLEVIHRDCSGNLCIQPLLAGTTPSNHAFGSPLIAADTSPSSAHVPLLSCPPIELTVWPSQAVWISGTTTRCLRGGQDRGGTWAEEGAKCQQLVEDC